MLWLLRTATEFHWSAQEMRTGVWASSFFWLSAKPLWPLKQTGHERRLMSVFTLFQSFQCLFEIKSPILCSLLLFLLSTRKWLHAVMFTKHSFSHLVYCCRTSNHLLSEIGPPPEKPSLLWLVSPHRPEQAPPSVFLHLLCWCFTNHGHDGGMAEGSDCIIVTSQHYRSPDGSFKTPAFWYFHSTYVAPGPAL